MLRIDNVVLTENTLTYEDMSKTIDEIKKKEVILIRSNSIFRCKYFKY